MENQWPKITIYMSSVFIKLLFLSKNLPVFFLLITVIFLSKIYSNGKITVNGEMKLCNLIVI